MKKLLMCIVSAFMSISLFVSPVDAKSEKKPLGPDYGTMTFGHYEQDGNEKNGEEPIEWIYIEVDDVGTVLISKYILDYYPKIDKRVDSFEEREMKWTTCRMRDWLNDDFYEKAFSKKEKKQILLNKNYNYEQTIDVLTSSYTKNTQEFTIGDGSISEDYVTILAPGTVERYETQGYLEPKALATPYACMQRENYYGVKETHEYKEMGYLTRCDNYNFYVNAEGELSMVIAYAGELQSSSEEVLAYEKKAESTVHYDVYGVRPVIVLKDSF